jgi:hypothetical protein
MTILNLFILVLLLISFYIFVWGWILFLRKRLINYAFNNVLDTGGVLRFIIFYVWVVINTIYTYVIFKQIFTLEL